MHYSDPHGERELQIFRAFVGHCPLKIDIDAIEKRDPPEPDIVCRTLNDESIAFELVEVIDSDLAQSVYGKMRLQEKFKEKYQSLSFKEQKEISSHVGNALINVCYERELGFSKRLDLIPRVFDEIKLIGQHSIEDHTPQPNSPLFGYVQTLRVSRGSYVGPIFDVAAFAWFDDPTLQRLEAKFQKTYEIDIPTELLVYYEIQPQVGRVEQSEVAEYVKKNVADSPFRRVWIYEIFGDRPPISLT